MQTVNYSDYIYYAGTTQPVVRVPVYVYEANTENLASLYDGSGAAIDNPTQTDDNGMFDFWTTFGKYDIYVHNTKEYSVSLLNLAYFYLGIYDANPTERPDGSELQDGDMYFNSVINHTKLYNNGLWYYADDMMNASGVAYDPASGPQTDVQTQMRAYDTHLDTIDTHLDTIDTNLDTIDTHLDNSVLNENIDIDDDTSVSDLGYTSLTIVDGGSFTIASGKTLTIDVPFSSGLYQVFSGDGSVVFGSGVVTEVYPEWWGSTKPISVAVDSLPASGGVVKLQAGIYVSDAHTTPITRDNYQIIGSGVPAYSSDYKSLTGGTIIQGPLRWQSSNVTMQGFGIDSGETVCTALFSGVAQEGLVSGDPQSPTTPYWTNNHISSISVLCQSSTAAVHAFLFENQAHGVFNDIRTVYGGAGIVIKGIGINASNVDCRGHNTYSFLIKSDSYAPAGYINCSNVLISNLLATPGSTWDTDGFMIQAAGAGAPSINVTNLLCIDVRQAIRLQGLSLNQVSDVNINGFYSSNNYFIPIQTDGPVKRVNISNGIIRNTGYGVTIGSDSETVAISNVYVENSEHWAFANSGIATRFIDCRSDNVSSSYYGLQQTDTGYCFVSNYTHTGTGLGAVTTATPGLINYNNRPQSGTVTVSALDTFYTLVGADSLYGLVVLRDNTNGGSALVMHDPNAGAVVVSSNITGFSTGCIQRGTGTTVEIKVTSGTVPRSIEWTFYL